MATVNYPNRHRRYGPRRTGGRVVLDRVLDLLRAVYRNPSLALTTRMRAAIAALAHEVPKLAVTAVMTDNDFATLLDRRLKRIEEMKANAIEATPVIDGEKVDPRLPDRRFRRI